jgi:hypothetical protein
MLYYLTIAFQLFCVYHVYKNANNYYWYFIIFFIPVIGCLVYLFTQVIGKRDLVNSMEEMNLIMNPTKKIKDLEQQLAFSNTFQNKINLADAFLETNDYENAILNYEDALKSNFKNNPHTLNKVIVCYFKLEKFDKVIDYSNKINLDKDFNETIHYLGLALEKIGDFEAAEIQLRKLNKRYSNYEERLLLSKFLLRRNKIAEAKEVSQEILLEIESMKSVNKRKYSHLKKEVALILDWRFEK